MSKEYILLASELLNKHKYILQLCFLIKTSKIEGQAGYSFFFQILRPKSSLSVPKVVGCR